MDTKSPSTFTPEDEAFGEENPILGAEYRAVQAVADRFLVDWKENHAEALAEAIVKPVLDTVMERVWDAFRDYLISDTELNAADEMRRMVERTVNALLGGKKWAQQKYIENPYGAGEQVRAELARLYADPIKDQRIADLEKEVARLQGSLDSRNGW